MSELVGMGLGERPVQDGQAVESASEEVATGAMDGYATHRSSYAETTDRAECEAAMPLPGQVLALAASAGSDWKVGCVTKSPFSCTHAHF